MTDRWELVARRFPGERKSNEAHISKNHSSAVLILFWSSALNNVFVPEAEAAAETKITRRLHGQSRLWPSPVGDADGGVGDERRRIRRQRRRGSDLQPKKTLLLLDLLSGDEPGVSVETQQSHNGLILLMRRRGNTSKVRSVINLNIIRAVFAWREMFCFSWTVRLFWCKKSQKIYLNPSSWLGCF